MSGGGGVGIVFFKAKFLVIDARMIGRWEFIIKLALT